MTKDLDVCSGSSVANGERVALIRFGAQLAGYTAAEEALTAPFLSLDDPLTNKLEVGRPQDIAEVAHLTKIKKNRRQ